MNDYKKMGQDFKDMLDHAKYKKELEENSQKAMIESAKRDWKFGIVMAIIGAILGVLGTLLTEYLKN
ncbi:MAG: hypothetical protein ACO1NK_04115 [Sediminibacterium sp.]|jgi:hypothetical protein